MHPVSHRAAPIPAPTIDTSVFPSSHQHQHHRLLSSSTSSSSPSSPSSFTTSELPLGSPSTPATSVFSSPPTTSGCLPGSSLANGYAAATTTTTNTSTYNTLNTFNGGPPVPLSPSPPPMPSPPLLTSTFRARELLRVGKGGMPEFVEPKVPEGISLRNFGIQVVRFLSFSFIPIFCLPFILFCSHLCTGNFGLFVSLWVEDCGSSSSARVRASRPLSYDCGTRHSIVHPTLTLDICVCILGTSIPSLPPIISHPLCAFQSFKAPACIALHVVPPSSTTPRPHARRSASACLPASCLGFSLGLCDGMGWDMMVSCPSQIALLQYGIAMRSLFLVCLVYRLICLYCGWALVFVLRGRASWYQRVGLMG